MVITYKNKYGTIRMNGGGHDNAWRIYEISGIGFPQKNFTYNTYAGIHGQELDSVSIASRIITISGDISERSQKVLSMASIMRILNEDGELRIQTGGKIRRAKVRTLSFEPEQRKSMYKKFVLQLEADNPFFFGSAPRKYAVFSRSALLTSPFMLPTAFSRRNMEADVINRGDVEAEPEIIISKPISSDVVEGDMVVLKNASTGSVLCLEHTVQPGEIITINISNRTIESNISGNIIIKISLDTVLRSFVLQPGKNSIVCDSSDISLLVSCEYEELYLEASHDE